MFFKIIAQLVGTMRTCNNESRSADAHVHILVITNCRRWIRRDSKRIFIYRMTLAASVINNITRFSTKRVSWTRRRSYS